MMDSIFICQKCNIQTVQYGKKGICYKCYMKEFNKKNYEKNKEKIKENTKIYYYKNHEKRKEYKRESQQTNILYEKYRKKYFTSK